MSSPSAKLQRDEATAYYYDNDKTRTWLAVDAHYMHHAGWIY